jgi:hypothetical protein
MFQAMKAQQYMSITATNTSSVKRNNIMRTIKPKLLGTALVFAVLLTITQVAIVNAQETTDCGNMNDCDFGLEASLIEAYVEPDFESPFLDRDLLHDRSYYQITGAMAVYDAPNGNIVRTLDAGFNFMTAINRVDGWIEINPGEWVPTSQAQNTNYVVSEFTGVFLPEEPLEYEIAWALVNVFPSKFPGGNPIESNGLTPRYTRVTLFSKVTIDGWDWYQIGVNKWVQQTQIAKVVSIERPEAVETERWVGVDLYEQVLIAYEGETPVFATLVSSGLPRWPTVEGTFNIYWRRLREDMTWGIPGDDFYYLEEVPWTMFFDEGRALHGAYWHDGLGYRRSHGCVNMSITDAHWLYHWVAEVMEKRTSADVEEGPAVHVYSSGVYVTETN